MKTADTWDRRFLALAEHIAGWSKDPSSKVGAVAVRDRRLLATGFNGFPVGIADDARLDEREAKYPRIVHAEQNVVAWAAREGVGLLGASLYVHPYHPCPDCAKLLVQAGISEIVHTSMDVPERWRHPFEIANQIFAEAGIDVRPITPEEPQG